MDLYRKIADKILVWVLNIVLATNVVIIFVFLFWGLYPYKPIEATDPFPTIETTYIQGEQIQYQADYCWKGNYPLIIDRRLVGPTIYPYPQVSNYSERGCYNQILNSPPLPLELEPGLYELRLVGIYRVNPLREIRVEFSTEQFEVIAK